MKLSDARQLARKLMDQHGLTTVPFKFNNAKARYGVCRWHGGFFPTCKSIELARQFVLLNDEPKIKNTILHEIAHALVGPGNGHNRKWRLKAMEIGCTAQRCTESAEKVKGRYKAVCPNCGATYYKYRKGRRVLTATYLCRKDRGKMKFVDTYAVA